MSEQIPVSPAEDKPKRKKKWLWVAGAIVLIIIIANMGNNDSNSSNNRSTSGGSEQTASKDKTYALNEEAKSGDNIWKVTSVRDRGKQLRASESRYASIAKAKTTAGKFIEVTITIENRGNDLATITDPNLIDDKNREFTTSYELSEWVPEGKELSSFESLQPNLPKEFVLIYEVPADAANFNLKVGVVRPQLIDLGI
jgi:hypothetical protein